MGMEKVNIILAAYNGEKYLRTLLDSILAQTYRNIEIFVRDDGSKDHTLQILEEYAKTSKSVPIHILRDDLGNLGYIANFLHTIRISSDADYYAFCDQDDYWLPDKIANAVELLSGRPKDRPVLYSCAYEVRNDTLAFVRTGHTPTPMERLDVGKALSLYDGGWLPGFTLVMNRALKEKAFDNNAEKMYSHDIWVQAVAAGFQGELIVDNRVGAYFRRHSDSTSIAETSVTSTVISAWIFRFKELFSAKSTFTALKDGMCTYADTFADQVARDRDRKFLKYFGTTSKRYLLQKVFYPHRLKQSVPVELAWRLAILLGKI